MNMKITFDVDGVLNNQSEYIANKLGLNYSKWTQYYLWDNTGEIRDNADIILEAFKNVDMFKDCGYLPGIERLMELNNRHDIELEINSHNFTEEIMNYKRKSLKEKIGIKDNQIHLALVDRELKEKVVDTDILVEDKIENIKSSNIRVKAILISQPYNIWQELPENTVRAESLNDAINIIEEIIK